MDIQLIKSLYEIYLDHPVVTTDSRQCKAGSIFFALRGERFNGNCYAAEVLQNGCELAVVDDATVVPDQPSAYGRHGDYFLVPDVLTTLQQLAAYHREAMRNWERPVTVIGITGTNGKTTTKELTLSVLSERYNVLATQGNLNNQIGVPLTLLRIGHEHQIAIIEMGANHPLDIEELCAIARPDYGLITNVGKAHLLGFGSLDGVVDAKTKLYESLRKDNGVAFIDVNNAKITAKADNLKTIGYGAGASAKDAGVKVCGDVVSCSPFLSIDMQFNKEENVLVNTHLIGSYNLINAIAAASVGFEFGVTAHEIKNAIEGYEPQNMRSQLVDLGHENYLILDAYNANPTSMTAALQSFSQNQAAHKNVILGDMRELGNESAIEHSRIVELLASTEIVLDNVILVGKEFEHAYQSADNNTICNMARNNIRCYTDVDCLCQDELMLRNIAGTTLIKGSRGIQLERVAEKMKSS